MYSHQALPGTKTPSKTPQPYLSWDTGTRPPLPEAHLLREWRARRAHWAFRSVLVPQRWSPARSIVFGAWRNACWRTTLRHFTVRLPTIDVLFTGENDRPSERLVTGVPHGLGQLSARRSAQISATCRDGRGPIAKTRTFWLGSGLWGGGQ